MRYFSSQEILLSCCVFLLYGIVGGVLYYLFFANTSKIVKILFCPLYVLKSKSFSPYISLRSNRYRKITKKIIVSFFEFIFFSVLGAVYIIFLYACCDCVFRFYTVFIAVISFCISYKLISLSLKKATNILVSKAFYIEYSILYALSVPMRICLGNISKLLVPIFCSITLRIKKSRFKRAVNQKSREQALILKNTVVNQQNRKVKR